MSLKFRGLRQRNRWVLSGAAAKVADEVPGGLADPLDINLGGHVGSSEGCEDVHTTFTRRPSEEKQFRTWFVKQTAAFDVLSWLGEFLLVALPTLAHDMSYSAGCPHAGAEHLPDAGVVCPDCGPATASAAAALVTFPCEGGNWVKFGHTIRAFRGHVDHAVARRDLTILLYISALMLVAGLTALRPSLYLRYRNHLILSIRLAVALGNTLAAVIASDACLASTTAPYYVSPHVAALALTASAASGGGGVAEGGGGTASGGEVWGARRVDGGGGGSREARATTGRMMMYVALKAVIWGRVLLSYQLMYGMMEWLNAVLVGYIVARRMYGTHGAAAATLQPRVLAALLIVYYVLPCGAVWLLERRQRALFRKLLVVRAPSRPATTRLPSANDGAGTTQQKRATGSKGFCASGSGTGAFGSRGGAVVEEEAEYRTTPINPTARPTPATALEAVVTAAGAVAVRSAAAAAAAATGVQRQVRPAVLHSATTLHVSPRRQYHASTATRYVSVKVFDHSHSGRQDNFAEAADRLHDVCAAAAEAAAATAAAADGTGTGGAASCSIAGRTWPLSPSPFALNSAVPFLSSPPTLRSTVIRGCVHLLGVVTTLLSGGAAAGNGGGTGSSGAGTSDLAPAAPVPVCHLEVSSMDELPQAQRQLQLVLSGGGVGSGGAVQGRASGGGAAFTLSPVAIATKLAAAPAPAAGGGAVQGEDWVTVDLLVWDVSVSDSGARGLEPPSRLQRVRVVVAGTSGCVVVLDETADVPPYGTTMESTEPGVVRLRIPAPASPGMAYVHLLPVTQERPDVGPGPTYTTATAHIEPADAGSTHRPLATLPLLVLPAAEAADEVCDLYDTMVTELHALETGQEEAVGGEGDDGKQGAPVGGGVSAGAGDGGGSGGSAIARAHVAAFHEHFAPLAGDVAYLIQWLTARAAHAGAAAGSGRASPFAPGVPEAEAGEVAAVSGAETPAEAAAAVVTEAEVQDVSRLTASVQSYLGECGLQVCLHVLRELMRRHWPYGGGRGGRSSNDDNDDSDPGTSLSAPIIPGPSEAVAEPYLPVAVASSPWVTSSSEGDSVSGQSQYGEVRGIGGSVAVPSAVSADDPKMTPARRDAHPA